MWLISISEMYNACKLT